MEVDGEPASDADWETGLVRQRPAVSNQARFPGQVQRTALNRARDSWSHSCCPGSPSQPGDSESSPLILNLVVGEGGRSTCQMASKYSRDLGGVGPH